MAWVVLILSGVLEAVWATALGKSTKAKGAPHQLTHEPVVAYTPQFTAYPQWSIVVSHTTSSTTPADE